MPFNWWFNIRNKDINKQIPAIHLILNMLCSYASSHCWGCGGLRWAKLITLSHVFSWEAIPLDASHSTLSIPDSGPINWDKGSKAEPVVSCWISDSVACTCQKYVSGIGKALMLQNKVSWFKYIPIPIHSGGSVKDKILKKIY